MTKEKAKELLPIITAFAEGKTIEVKNSKNEWNEIDDPHFDVNPKAYRIKPEPEYRPFESAEEFLIVMKQHTPYGYVRLKNAKHGTFEYCNIVSFTNGDIILQTCKGLTTTSYVLAFETLVFSDGRPFGVYKGSDI